MMLKILLLPLVCVLTFSLHATTFYVDNLNGNDNNAGTKEQPFASLDKGIKALQTSDRLEVIANKNLPYTRPYYGVNGKEYAVGAGGTKEQPLIINGNGAIISGLSIVPSDRWTKVSDNIYKLPFWPMSNLYKNFPKQDYWNDSLKIWFVDGENAKNALSKKELENTPNSFWWSRSEKSVYYHLAENKTLEELKIQLPANSGFYTHGDYTTIENFIVIYSWNDGFDTANTATNTVYKNCVAINNCGQAFSCHGDSTATYIDCVAISCGSAGFTNAHNSRVEYNRCVIMDNVFEAGAFAADKSSSTLNDCLVIDNTPMEQLWAHGTANLSLNNSIVKSKNQNVPVAFVRNGALSLNKCTIIGGSFFNTLQKDSVAKITISDSILGNFKDFLMTVTSANYTLKNNLYFNTKSIILNGKAYYPNDFAQYKIDLGGDENSEYVIAVDLNPNTNIPTRNNDRGAELPESVWELYNKYKNIQTTPLGVEF